MAIRLLQARRVGNSQIRLLVWIDTTKALPGGEPHPDWLMPFVWHPVSGETFNAFKARVKTETKAIVLEELASRQGPIEEILPEEGTDI